MRAKEVAHQVKIMQAWLSGKSIECRQRTAQIEWRFVPHPDWDWRAFDFRVLDLKPQIVQDAVYILTRNGHPLVSDKPFTMFGIPSTMYVPHKQGN